MRGDLRKSDLWGSLSTGVDKLPQRSLFSEVAFLMYYDKIFCVYTSERALSIVAEKDCFAIDLKSFYASIEYQELRGEKQWRDLHAYTAIT